MKIGFFDSGIGGLTILRAVREHLPEYDYVYYADSANLPYGDKREEEVFELTKAGVMRLFNERAVLVIVACNTASAQALRRLQDSMLTGVYKDRRVLGVIIPTVEAIEEMKVGRVLLIGTARTVHSEKYPLELGKINPSTELLSESMPTLVPLIESGDLTAALRDVQKVVDPKIGKIDTLVLGCTHYTVLKDDLRALYPNLTIIAQDEILPPKLKAYLSRHPEIEKKLGKHGSIKVLDSGEGARTSTFKKDLVRRLTGGE
jgi:glutamate racemase